MNTYNVLLVDDDEPLVELWVRALKEIPGVMVREATTVEGALKELKSQYFHLAIVDMDFHSRPDGTRIFKFLSEHRPSCEAILATAKPADYPTEFFDLVNPVAPMIRGAINKVQLRDSLANVVRAKSKGWLQHTVDIDKSEVVVEQLRQRNSSRFKVEITPCEVDYLISRLLGQGLFSAPSSHEVKRTQVELLHGGRSSSVVVKCRPSTRDGREGIWTVIKISPREDAAEEYERYCRFVRYLVSLNARVELLGYESADTLGAVCYSFAGKSPADVITLNDLFVNAIDFERTSEVFNRLFGTGSKFWYDMPGHPVTLEDYLFKVYQINTPVILREIESVFREVLGEVAEVRPKGRELIWRGEVIRSPNSVIGGAYVRTPIPTCIVHGDMNANNIIVGEDNRVIMIDYRHTQFSPRTLDFAALECGLRLAQAAKCANYAAVLPFHAQERWIWEDVWRGGRQGDDTGESTLSYWQRTSICIAQHARTNFPDLQEREYAVVCLGWALRILRVRGLTVMERWRLMLWASHLCGSLLDVPGGKKLA